MLLYIAMIIVVTIPVIGILKLLSIIVPAPSGGGTLGSLVDIFFSMCISITLILAAWMTLHWFDRRPIILLGLVFSTRGIREFSLGFGIGFVNMFLLFILLWTLGFIEVTAININLQGSLIILQYMVFFTFGAAIEELIFRGYFFQTLIESTRSWIATLIVSLAFAAIHVSNANYNLLSALHLFMHGILFCLVYIKTRSLWIPIGMHAAWNWVQGALLGINVSGTPISNSLLTSMLKGGEILSGGEFGIEGSILSPVLSLIIIIYLWKAKWFKPSQFQYDLWKKYPAGFGIAPLAIETNNISITEDV
ncbi:MAG: type II CAAX endopeptidase family protein [Ignavibacteria bacterium]